MMKTDPLSGLDLKINRGGKFISVFIKVNGMKQSITERRQRRKEKLQNLYVVEQRRNWNTLYSYRCHGIQFFHCNSKMKIPVSTIISEILFNFWWLTKHGMLRKKVTSHWIHLRIPVGLGESTHQQPVSIWNLIKDDRLTIVKNKFLKLLLVSNT